MPWVIRPLRAIKSGTFALPGKGDGLITPIYVDDLVDCIVRALFDEGARGQKFTCWDGDAVTAREFFGHHARWLGKSIRTVPRPLAVAALGLAELTGRDDVRRASLTFISRRATYPNARARELLGWEPRVSLDEGMRRSAEWARAEGLV